MASASLFVGLSHIMPDKRLLAMARSKNMEVMMLPPEKGHPIPAIGYRLMKWVPIKDKLGRTRHKWVCIMFGHPEVLKAIVQSNGESLLTKSQESET